MKSWGETPIERALIDATLEEYSDVPDCEDKIAIQLSDHFIRKTEKLNRKTVSKGWKYQNTVWKRVALIAILAAVLAASAMAIPAVRELSSSSSMMRAPIMRFHSTQYRQLLPRILSRQCISQHIYRMDISRNSKQSALQLCQSAGTMRTIGGFALIKSPCRRTTRMQQGEAVIRRQHQLNEPA